MNPVEVLVTMLIVGAVTATAGSVFQAASDVANTRGFNAITDCTRDVLEEADVAPLDAITAIRDDTLDPDVRTALEECAYPLTGDPNDPYADIPEDIINDLERNE